jgi:integrase
MTPEMGRPKTVYLNLPPRMTARRLRSGRVLYYYGQKKIPLGSDLNAARIKWASHENGVSDSGRFAVIAKRWEAEELPKLAIRTQQSYGFMLAQLEEAFRNFTLDQIRPVDVRRYLDLRSAKVSANREVSLLSTIFNWARERGLTSNANPCLGVTRHQEKPRRRYVTDEEYAAIMAKAPAFLQDAMDLALLTGQRPSDVLKMTRQDMRDGCLWVAQAKTGAKVGITLDGDLEVVLQRILARPHDVQSMYLISDEQGQRVNYWSLHHAFLKTGADWQFRDLRAKMVTDEKDLKVAQQRAGHTTEVTTARVYRRVKGNVVKPLKRGN